MKQTSCCGWIGFLGVLLFSGAIQAQPQALDDRLQIRHVMNTAELGSRSIRIARSPLDNQLYFLKQDGTIYRLNLDGTGALATTTVAASAADHGISNAAGFAIGPEGNFYLVGNTTINDNAETFASIVRGVVNEQGARAWSVLAQSEPYPRSQTAFDHVFNGIIVSLDGSHVFVNSGSRTDHGEVQSGGGLFPGVREVPLTAAIFRLPAGGNKLLLRNDRQALIDDGFLFAEGVRNVYDMAFAPSGDLFGTENGPDRDMPDSIYWLRQGRHYGFPWRMGGEDNPQQFPDYDPATDPLLDPRFIAVARGYYHNDPGFPPPPPEMTDPIINIGPDAAKYRDPVTGEFRDAVDDGKTFHTVTGHRSPLGLVFDRAGVLGGGYRWGGFVLSWTRGDATGNSVPGPFHDASEDLLHLDLTKLGEINYEARITKIAGGFSNPIDSAMVANRLYVIEYGGSQGIWEITFPVGPDAVSLKNPEWHGNRFEFLIRGIPGHRYQTLMSPDLKLWTILTNITLTTTEWRFVDEDVETDSSRFYRVVPLD